MRYYHIIVIIVIHIIAFLNDKDSSDNDNQINFSVFSVLPLRSYIFHFLLVARVPSLQITSFWIAFRRP